MRFLADVGVVGCDAGVGMSGGKRVCEGVCEGSLGGGVDDPDCISGFLVSNVCAVVVDSNIWSWTCCSDSVFDVGNLGDEGDRADDSPVLPSSSVSCSIRLPLAYSVDASCTGLDGVVTSVADGASFLRELGGVL